MNMPKTFSQQNIALSAKEIRKRWFFSTSIKISFLYKKIHVLGSSYRRHCWGYIFHRFQFDNEWSRPFFLSRAENPLASSRRNTFTHAYLHTFIRMHTYIYTNTFIRTHAHIYTHTYLQSQIYTYPHSHTLLRTFTHKHTHLHIPI